MTQDDLRARLATLGLTLDDAAFAAAWAGVLHLRAEVAKVRDYLARSA
jgi:hypothetical protein